MGDFGEGFGLMLKVMVVGGVLAGIAVGGGIVALLMWYFK